MVLHIGICDDEESQRNFLEEQVKFWAQNKEIEVKITCFSSAEAFLFHYELDPTYQILLLDIEMLQMNGVELARKIRRENKEIQIIFISGYQEYIADGYEVEALNYLLKPVQSLKLYEVLNRALTKLSLAERALIIETGAESVRVPLYAIRYVDVFRNYVTIHATKELRLKTTLSKLAQELDERFFRVGRSAIVNLQSIHRVTKTDIFLTDGARVPLPRGYYDKVHQAMIERL